MAKQKKDEIVSASFHYLERTIPTDDSGPSVSPFSEEEFDKLCEKIAKQKMPDLNDVEDFNSLKFGRIVPFSNVKRISDRKIFGVFEGAYWGHSFRNSEKGEISAESINQRQFHFLIYHAEDGKIFVGCQYLGNYGAYSPLKKTLIRYLPSNGTISSVALRQDKIDFNKYVPKEVKVSLYSKGKKINEDNFFQNGSMLAVKKRSADDGFEQEVKRSFLSLIGLSESARRKAIASIVGSSIVGIKDEDIEGCSVVASFKGRERVVYVLGENNFASRYTLDVPIGYNGHPNYDETCAKMLDVLKYDIIAAMG